MLNTMTEIVLISGPSQVGKSTIQDRLLRIHPLERVVTRTTRPKRKGEVEGEDYMFTSRDVFETMISHGRFIETNEYSGNLYGTDVNEYKRISGDKKIPLQVVDVNGAQAIRSWCKENLVTCTSIFIMPENLDVLRTRLQGFSDAQERTIIAQKEMERAYEFDHVFVNKKVNLCISQILSYLDSKGILDV